MFTECILQKDLLIDTCIIYIGNRCQQRSKKGKYVAFCAHKGIPGQPLWHVLQQKAQPSTERYSFFAFLIAS